jgi:hypothetical protein
MKPLLHAKITRERRVIGDYIPAAEQATDDGRNDFAERQRRRIADAQADAKETQIKVRDLRKAAK